MNDKEYKAIYLGAVEMFEWSDIYSLREFWHIENAYDDMKNKRMTNSVLPFNNYPIPANIETGQVFAVDYYLKADGSVERKYYIADGTVWNDLPATREFVLE